MEYLDVVDENGEPTGEIVSRKSAHRTGARHRTSHLWLVRKRDEKWQVLLQLRSFQKDSHPGCLDTSSAGHIPAGYDYIESAIRELKEELGLTAKPEDLVFVARRHFEYEKEFHGKPFHDNQVSKVFYLLWDGEPSELVLQESEIADAMWMNLDECVIMVRDGSKPNCIDLEEILMIRDALQNR